MNILNSIMSIKQDICLYAVHEYKSDTVKSIVDTFIRDDLLDRLSASDLTAVYKWPGGQSDQTPQVIWMLEKCVPFTEYRKHYYSICDYYGPFVEGYCIEITVTANSTQYDICINVPTGLINIHSEGISASDSIVFNILDLSRYIEKISAFGISTEYPM